jgi:hypothetical protein
MMEINIHATQARNLRTVSVITFSLSRYLVALCNYYYYFILGWMADRAFKSIAIDGLT